jgi:hypothetical protein
LEYLVCHVFSFVPTFGRAMESGWPSEVLEIHEHEDAAKCSLTKKPNSSISFLFFDAITCSCIFSLNKHQDLMEAYTVVSSNLLNIIELDWKIHRKPLYLMVKNIKNI